MRDLEKRIEVALRAVDEASRFVTRGYIDRGDIETAIRAAFPELFSTPPTLELAPAGTLERLEAALEPSWRDA
jgi:hypothetical protein